MRIVVITFSLDDETLPPPPPQKPNRAGASEEYLK